MTHPYEHVSSYQLHRGGIADRPPAMFDPIVKAKFTLQREAPIATMGSCFAQHLSKRLLASGINFLRTEPTHEDAGGIFSANFGNIYSVAQGLQLYRYAFGEQKPSEEMWLNASGKYVDPLRPGPTHAGFNTLDAALKARREHYGAVRRMFQDASALVFTLGLTEAWRRHSDGAILPLAPGVSAGTYVPAEYGFVNFDFEQVYEQLSELVHRVAHTRPSIKIVLTVSPVPLAATFEDRHVAVSSMESKAILRAAAGAAARKYDHVAYFPSFEIFFTPGIGAAYFDTDCRHVTAAGVAHAMRIFDRHYLDGGVPAEADRIVRSTVDLRRARTDVWCDEDNLMA